VIGSRGRGLATALGSTATDLLNRSPVPVMVVP
jgi:nucleotide-binding universal stress UspA family protein